MTRSLLVDALAWLFATGSVVAAWRVFRTDSMVRAAYWLLVSFAGVAGIFLLLGAEFLGLVLLLMMSGEMTIMAVFMVMFMMNPAGLNPMTMVHQHRAATLAGVVTAVGLAAVAVLGSFPAVPAAAPGAATAGLGRELLGDSMLVFQTAGVALLSTMIGAIAIASRRGRFGDAEEGSAEPELGQPGSTGQGMQALGGSGGTAEGEKPEEHHHGHEGHAG